MIGDDKFPLGEEDYDGMGMVSIILYLYLSLIFSFAIKVNLLHDSHSESKEKNYLITLSDFTYFFSYSIPLTYH